MNIISTSRVDKSKNWQFGVVGLIVLFISWLGSLGFFDPLDSTLRDMRFLFDNRAPTGEVVLVEIDPKSLEHFGVWPWPRSLHARAIDALVDYGAYNIALDIDFSSNSTPENDALMEKALEDAGGFVILASFAQQSGSDGRITYNRPIEEFYKNSWAASVNVGVDKDGRVRRFPYSNHIDDQRVPSFPVALSGIEVERHGGFVVDYSIDVSQIDRISFLDVVNGNVAPERLANKNVIIGAGAVELRDNFAVARYGVLSGPMLQVLATETLLQSRQLKELGPWIGYFIVALLCLIYFFSTGRLSFILVITCVSAFLVALEIFGFFLQSRYGLLFDTAILHVTQFTLLLGFLAHELDRRLGIIGRETREKAVTQSILKQVITDNFDGVVVVDHNLEIRMASGLAEETLNQQSETSLVGRLAEEVLPAQLWNAVWKAFDTDSGIIYQFGALSHARLETESGGEVFLEFVVTRSLIDMVEVTRGAKEIENSKRVVACLTFRDITEQRKTAQKLEYIAHHDSLTGALLRVKLGEEIMDFLATENGLKSGITVGVLDLHRLKEVNETLGHAVGDQLLKQVATRIKESEIAHVSRIGGHSFAFCVEGALGEIELETFCSSLIETLCAPYLLGEHRVIVGASIGVTDSFVSGSLPDILFAHADMALSRVGSNSRKSYWVYSHDLEEKLLRKQEVEAALRIALDGDELWVAYQPQICLKTGKLIGVEALIRWEHPDWGLVSPDQFIPVAEEIGLIVEIGQWILEQACLDAVHWPVPIDLAVNVSPLQFEFSDVGAGVALALERSGLPASRLSVEITESNFVKQSQCIIDTLDDLRARGIGVALDDFGTGYSSLSYLSRLPIDKIKVDQSFVRKLPGDKATLAIVRSVLALGEALDKMIVAEGIETEEQAEILLKSGAQIGQGYLFGRPMNDVELRGYMLKEFWQEPATAKVG